jgi:hypothetical protein
MIMTLDEMFYVMKYNNNNNNINLSKKGFFNQGEAFWFVNQFLVFLMTPGQRKRLLGKKENRISTIVIIQKTPIFGVSMLRKSYNIYNYTLLKEEWEENLHESNTLPCLIFDD